MPDRGTRNAIFVLRMLCEWLIENQQDVILCFINYQKIFDKVHHSHLLTVLKRIGIDDKDFGIIRNLYYEQIAAIKLTEGLIEWTDIKRGVRQGCIMSPDLFNLYSEFILKELEEVEEENQVNGRHMHNMRYADDTVHLASSDVAQQMLLNVGQISSERFGLKLNINKTKVMVMSERSPNEPSISITVNNVNIEQVQHLNYLGSWLSTDGRCGKEIRRRINLPKRSFQSMKSIFRD